MLDINLDTKYDPSFVMYPLGVYCPGPGLSFSGDPFNSRKRTDLAGAIVAAKEFVNLLGK